MTISGRWSDDVLSGPCKIVLLNNKSAYPSTGTVIRNTIFYASPFPKSTGITGRKLFVSTVNRDRRLTAAANAKTNNSQLQYPCKPRSPVVAEKSVQNCYDCCRRIRLVPIDLPLIAEESVKNMIDLMGHLEKMAAKRLKNDEYRFKYRPSLVTGRTDDLKLEFQAAEFALETYLDRLKELYRAYGAFLADGPVTYRPIMTRLGLWQILIDNRLHARLSLADFDNLLCEYIIRRIIQSLIIDE